jgi:hypothetical protein
MTVDCSCLTNESPNNFYNLFLTPKIQVCYGSSWHRPPRGSFWATHATWTSERIYPFQITLSACLNCMWLKGANDHCMWFSGCKAAFVASCVSEFQICFQWCFWLKLMANNGRFNQTDYRRSQIQDVQLFSFWGKLLLLYMHFTTIVKVYQLHMTTELIL